MVFDSITSKITGILDTIRGADKLTAENIEEAVQEMRKVLLDADVNFQVANSLVKAVKEKAVGERRIDNVNPSQQFVKILYDELVDIMGGDEAPIATSATDQPTVLLLAGLQGAGKTTAAAKLALYLQTPQTRLDASGDAEGGEGEGGKGTMTKPRKVLLVAADVYRPAAIDQLQILGERVGCEVFTMGQDVDPVDIVKQGVAYAKEQGYDTVIVDTAGRQVVDDALMAELKRIKEAVPPDEVLLVVDAMTGQEAALLTQTFNEQIGISGAILTKLDGDTRGGSALSVRGVSGKPIKFVGVGEGMDKLEPFYPKRMASRIIGMGDVVSLVEKAQKQMSERDALDLTKRIQKGQYDFNDFMKQSDMINKMGSVGQFLSYIPGMSNMVSRDQIKTMSKKFRKYRTFIDAMTEEERESPDLFTKEKGAQQRMRRLADETDEPIEEVQGFVRDFMKQRRQMMLMSRQMMGGADLDKAASGDETALQTMQEGNRKQRREAARKAAKKKKKLTGFG
ncbi:unnamed protein product [Vitrella brassicaformis CCMP3155]|uniref:signal-recognition-particle GTPase n=1 Tax=Vitrella brassicaformis (strain CCMP3155) TaxID=1169540 RepID=A0A0G4GPH7_VITBC|nr:unnamed protein product [Vitrella brassicaformis CCMP3155]|eukprot:CEM32083.1 unnamed protein product [Vitrella brassicaformis CCMP3155]